MKLILKNKHIYLPVSNNVVSDNAPFTVDILDKLDINNYSKLVTINGTQRSFEDTFTISKKELSQRYLQLTISLVHRDTGEVLEYKADPYPITRAFMLGRPFNECYPSIINNLLERINKLEELPKQVDANSKTIKEHSDELYAFGKAIKELKEEGEIV